MKSNPELSVLLQIAGWAQLGLAMGSLLIPRILRWKEALLPVSTLIRQLFWTYAAYILVINGCFGVLSVSAPSALLDGSLLATIITGFITAYWASRILIQFLYFSRDSFPKGVIYLAGELLLVGLFFFLVVIYGWAACFNYVSK